METEEEVVNRIRYKTDYCPYCEAKTQFNLVFPAIETNSINQAIIEFKAGKSNIGDRWQTIFYIKRCQVCSNLIFRAIRTDSVYNTSNVIGLFPKKYNLTSRFEGYVSPKILEDFLSALKCYEIAEYRASVAMSRRSLQVSLLLEGAKKGDNLKEQIKQMNEKDSDKFPNSIKDWAHEIRHFGNIGAHPDIDGLEDIDENDAKTTIDFLANYFQYVYVMPKMVIDSRSSRDDTPDK